MMQGNRREAEKALEFLNSGSFFSFQRRIRVYNSFIEYGSGCNSVQLPVVVMWTEWESLRALREDLLAKISAFYLNKNFSFEEP
jgi:hypothetical protein